MLLSNNYRSDSMIDAILQQKFKFSAIFVIVFGVSFGVLFALDFYPEPPQPLSDTPEAAEGESEETEEPSRLRLEAGAGAALRQPNETDNVVESSTPTVTAEPETLDSPESTSQEPASVAHSVATPSAAALPVSITFNSLNRTVDILNPTSRSIADLDAALLNGAVRHPDSATFTNEGTIFVLGHSSYLPNVINKNYQAFNGIQNLKWGETIDLASTDAVYTYRIDRVYQAKASELTVPIAGTGPKLVIATCNSFASKDDRYMVEATLVESRTL